MKIDLFSIGKFTIHGYGLMIAIGILCCVAMASYRAKKNGLDQEAIVDIGIYGVIGGFLGAKILYVIVEFKTFIKDPKTVLGSEGFVVYGGIIAGFLTAIVYCRIKKLYFLNILISLWQVFQWHRDLEESDVFLQDAAMEGDNLQIWCGIPGRWACSGRCKTDPDTAYFVGGRFPDHDRVTSIL